MNIQHVHQDSSNYSFSNLSNLTTTRGGSQHVDTMSSCLTWDSFLFLLFFLMFLGSVVFSSAANGFLLFLLVRYKQILWQPQYILLKNVTACGIAISFVIGFVILTSVYLKQTQINGLWCIAQFSMLRCFFLMSQMTLAMMAAERYIFICHGIHYLRLINTHNIQLIIFLMWLISGAVSFHGGFVLSHILLHSFQQQTSGLLCDAVTIKEHITFSQEENVLVFGPPSVITTFCVLAICYCYGCMYHAALRVSTILKCSNYRANRTVGFYFLMFLLQLASSVFFIVLSMRGEKKASSCKTIRSIVSPLLIIIPTCINAVYFITRNPQARRVLFSACHHICLSTVREEVQMLQQSTRGNEMEEDIIHQVNCKRQEQIDNIESAPSPLPGCVFISISEASNH